MPTNKDPFQGDTYIYQINEVHFENLDKDLDKDDNSSSRAQLELLHSFVESGNLYHARGYDITCTQQTIETFSEEQKVSFRWKRARNRFFWNDNALKMFQLSEFSDEWITPVMYGHVNSVTACELGSRHFDFLLISRVSNERAGVRFHRRGLDDSLGYCANVVETEQIIMYSSNGDCSSFVQIRGSCPLIWQQLSDFSFFPPIDILASHNVLELPVFKYYFKRLMSNYGFVVCLDALSRVKKSKGKSLDKALQKASLSHRGQHLLSECYESNLANLNTRDAMYFHFDLKRLCKDRDMVKLSTLREKVHQYFQTVVELPNLNNQEMTGLYQDGRRSPTNGKKSPTNGKKSPSLNDMRSSKDGSESLSEGKSRTISGDESADNQDLPKLPPPNANHCMNFFSITDTGLITSLQAGVFRTNCLDSSDRTNIVQSEVGLYVLCRQLGLDEDVITHVIKKGFKTKIAQTFNLEIMERLRKAYSENGNILSRMYTGTDALRSQFVKTGSLNTIHKMIDSTKVHFLEFPIKFFYIQINIYI